MISTVNAVIGADSLNTGLHTTTPDAPDVQRLLAQMVAAGIEICVLEVTSHGLAQHRVAACDFDVAAVTNITHEHLDLHGSLSAYRGTKARLFKELLIDGHRKPGVGKTAILNRGDSSFEYLQSSPADLQLTYNLGRPGDVIAYNLVQSADRTRFDVKSPYGQFSLETRLLGTFNVFNVMAATATCLSLGMEPEAIQGGVAAMPGIPGRMERVDRGQPFTAIVDFAHTPNSLRRALETARDLATGGRVTVVFGCAGLRDVEKRPIMGHIAAQLADHTILTAEDPRTEDLNAIIEQIAEGCREAGGVEGQNFERVTDRGAALARAVELAGPGDVVIACGKGHEQSMCFGETEYPWDDREALAAALEGHPLKTLPTATG